MMIQAQFAWCMKATASAKQKASTSGSNGSTKRQRTQAKAEVGLSAQAQTPDFGELLHQCAEEVAAAANALELNTGNPGTGPGTWNGIWNPLRHRHSFVDKHFRTSHCEELEHRAISAALRRLAFAGLLSERLGALQSTHTQRLSDVISKAGANIRSPLDADTREGKRLAAMEPGSDRDDAESQLYRPGFAGPPWMAQRGAGPNHQWLLWRYPSFGDADPGHCNGLRGVGIHRDHIWAYADPSVATPWPQAAAEAEPHPFQPWPHQAWHRTQAHLREEHT